MDIKEIAAKYEDYTVKMRRLFHENAELSMQEFATAKIIRDELDKIGVSWRPCGGPTGTRAVIGGKKPGKCVLLRGDIDAMTVNEETGFSYASKTPGVMHACGHDSHAAMLLTAAHILKEVEDDLNGTVVLAFQPGEENTQGAHAMLSEGVLDGVDAVFAMHTWGTIESGVISCEAGPRMASCGQFRIDITGAAGHGSAPHQCVDASVVAAATVMNLQTIASRESDPQQPVVVSVGVLQSGTKWNVIPGTAVIEGTTRAYDPAIVKKFPEQIRRIAQTTAELFRAKADVWYDEVCIPEINDERLSEIAENAAGKIVGAEMVKHVEKLSAAEDFSYFMEQRPGVQAFLGNYNPEVGAVYPNHHGKFTIDESVLIKGAAFYAQFAADALENM